MSRIYVLGFGLVSLLGSLLAAAATAQEPAGRPRRQFAATVARGRTNAHQTEG